MARISKKYALGGEQPKKPAPKPKPYYTLRNDYAEPGAREREASMTRELMKKGPVREETSKPAPKPAPKKKLGGKIVKAVKKLKKSASGSSLKPVDKSKNPGLSKLPTPVRNKMGYQKMGGKTKKAKMGCASCGKSMKKKK